MTGNFQDLLKSFGSQRIAVVGDVMLDRYWMGDASRISPEAPVPIVLKQKTVCYPGGAGNVAVNLAALGASVMLFGVLGEDAAAAELRTALAEGGVSSEDLFADRGRLTTVKTRVIAGRQQITRIDEEDTHALPRDLEFAMLEKLRARLRFSDCVLVSDYAKGLISPSFAAALLPIAREAGVPVIVDPKGSDVLTYRGATVIKPNRVELSMLTGLPVRSHPDALAACDRLQSLLPGVVVLLTEGAEGMTLYLPNREHVRLPTRALEVFDVTGAGDTALAVTGLAIACGAGFWAAAVLANCAAGVVVGEFGCGKVTVERLRAALAHAEIPAAPSAPVGA
ncbi:MAG: D-glycero-beta-D-manno-heptose-7-phosphate kinase [Acidobacteriaceae bacterium]|nr:D-glycero-beta-D-manno-heptose-7-phosphate kinase [Acidobacteriaceae bacterium]